MGTKTIALFGPTETWRYKPYGEGHEVISLDLDCQPCHEKECDTWECMEELEVDDVIKRVKSGLGDNYE